MTECDECGHGLGDGPDERPASDRIDGLCVVCAVDQFDTEQLNETLEKLE